MGENSKFPKSWFFKTSILKFAVCPLNIHNFKFKWSMSLDRLKINQRSCYDLPNSAFLRLTFCGKSASKSWIQDIILKTYTHASTISACFHISIEWICKKCQTACPLCLEPQMPKILAKPTAQLACKSGPLLTCQRNAYSGGPIVVRGCPLVTFVTPNLTKCCIAVLHIVLILFPIP